MKRFCRGQLHRTSWLRFVMKLCAQRASVMRSRPRSIEGRHWGFYVIRSESGTPGDFSDLTDEQLAEKLRAYKAIDDTP